MRVLVFQHIPVEHPGIFRDFLAQTSDGLIQQAQYHAISNIVIRRIRRFDLGADEFAFFIN